MPKSEQKYLLKKNTPEELLVTPALPSLSELEMVPLHQCSFLSGCFFERNLHEDTGLRVLFMTICLGTIIASGP